VRNVLLVNRDPELLAALERDLTTRGYHATATLDTTEALAILSRRPMDVVVADLGALGTNVLLEQAARSPRTRAIVTSAEAGVRDYQQAIASGAIQVLRAPVRPPDMLHAIRSALGLEDGFPSNLRGRSPIDVLLMAHHGRRSLELVVEGWDVGRVFLEQGEVIHAASLDLVGEPALHRILRLPAGSLHAVVLPPGTPRTITRAFRPLLLDALRGLEEGEP
jgi:CheY-like chemotaxis protein